MTVLLVQLLIGSVWGITNALMKQGAMVAQERRRKKEGPLQPGPSGVLQRFPVVHDWLALLLVWEYLLPFILNLGVSAFFFLKLKDSSLSMAVPVTNAITFAITAMTGASLGEPVDTFYTTIGIVLTVLGVSLCVYPGGR